jgi:hypothetical protein
MKAALLAARAVIKVIGDDARKFLHGLQQPFKAAVTKVLACDSSGQKLACVYCEEEPDRRAAVLEFTFLGAHIWEI